MENFKMKPYIREFLLLTAMKNKLFILLIILITAACSSDEKIEITTSNLDGYISDGAATGVYSGATIRITKDSLIMRDMPMSRLTSSLSKVRDTTLEDRTGTMEFYNIMIVNSGKLTETEFIDSVIVKLSELELIR